MQIRYDGELEPETPVPFLDVEFDYIERSNPDSNGYYQTWEFKVGGAGGTLVRTLTLTYDAQGNFLTMERS